VKFIPFFLLSFYFFSLPYLGQCQSNLSKKERKAQEIQATVDRLFIEGEKASVLGDWKKAYLLFNKALELAPEEAAISYKMAEVLGKNTKHEKALPFAQRAVDLDPSNSFYALLLAELYHQLEQPMRAAEILDKLTQESSKNQSYTLDLASIYLDANEFDKALVVLDRAEAYYGVREPFTVQKQRIYLRKNNLPKAIEEGEKLIASFPGNASYVLGLVEILYNNGRLDQAISLVEGEIQKYPDQPELQMAAYTLISEKGDASRALPHLILGMKSTDLPATAKAKAYEGILEEIKTQERESILDTLEYLMLESYPEDASIFEAFGKRRMSEKQVAEGIAFYKKSLSLAPNNQTLLEEVILNSFEVNTPYQEVENYTQMAVEEFPELAAFWFYDGVVKSAQKKDSLAVISLEHALRLNENKNQQLAQVAYGTLANSQYNLGLKDKAFANFEKALAIDSKDDLVLNNYAYFLSLEKLELEKAKNMAERVVKRNPNNSTYLDTLAWILFQMKKYAEALPYIEKAILLEKDPGGVLMEHYGDILYHLNWADEAISWWKKAQQHPEGSEKLAQKIKEGKYHE
jgi:tetratricopeptide (TPR) repeat protein